MVDTKRRAAIRNKVAKRKETDEMCYGDGFEQAFSKETTA